MAQAGAEFVHPLYFEDDMDVEFTDQPDHAQQPDPTNQQESAGDAAPDQPQPAVDADAQPASAEEEEPEPESAPDSEFSSTDSETQSEGPSFPFDSDPEEDIPVQHRGAPRYIPGLHDLLYLNARYTIIQAVFMLVSIKQKNNMSDTAFQDMLQAHKEMLPQPNKLPETWYRCMSMLGVKRSTQYEWHTCSCQMSAWDPQGPRTPEDFCPHCLDRRFKRDRHGKLRAVQVSALSWESKRAGPWCVLT